MYIVVVLCILYVVFRTYIEPRIQGHFSRSILESYPDLRGMLADFPETPVYHALLEKNLVAFLKAYRESFQKGDERLRDMRKYARRIQKYALEIILRLPGDLRLQEILEDHLRHLSAFLETLMQDIEIRHRVT